MKPEWAGRKVKCKCGSSFRVPEPAKQEPSPDQLFEMLAESSPAKDSAKMSARPRAAACPSCGGAMAPGAVICTACGLNIQTGQTIGGSTGSPAGDTSHRGWRSLGWPAWARVGGGVVALVVATALVTTWIVGDGDPAPVPTPPVAIAPPAPSVPKPSPNPEPEPALEPAPEPEPTPTPVKPEPAPAPDPMMDPNLIAGSWYTVETHKVATLVFTTEGTVLSRNRDWPQPQPGTYKVTGIDTIVLRPNSLSQAENAKVTVSGDEMTLAYDGLNGKERVVRYRRCPEGVAIDGALQQAIAELKAENEATFEKAKQLMLLSDLVIVPAGGGDGFDPLVITTGESVSNRPPKGELTLAADAPVDGTWDLRLGSLEYPDFRIGLGVFLKTPLQTHSRWVSARLVETDGKTRLVGEIAEHGRSRDPIPGTVHPCVVEHNPDLAAQLRDQIGANRKRVHDLLRNLSEQFSGRNTVLIGSAGVAGSDERVALRLDLGGMALSSYATNGYLATETRIGGRLSVYCQLEVIDGKPCVRINVGRSGTKEYESHTLVWADDELREIGERTDGVAPWRLRFAFTHSPLPPEQLNAAWKQTVEQFSRTRSSVGLIGQARYAGHDMPLCVSVPVRGLLGSAGCSIKAPALGVSIGNSWAVVDPRDPKTLRALGDVMSFSKTPDMGRFAVTDWQLNILRLEPRATFQLIGKIGAGDPPIVPLTLEEYDDKRRSPWTVTRDEFLDAMDHKDYKLILDAPDGGRFIAYLHTERDERGGTVRGYIVTEPSEPSDADTEGDGDDDAVGDNGVDDARTDDPRAREPLPDGPFHFRGPVKNELSQVHYITVGLYDRPRELRSEREITLIGQRGGGPMRLSVWYRTPEGKLFAGTAIRATMPRTKMAAQFERIAELGYDLEADKPGPHR